MYGLFLFTAAICRHIFRGEQALQKGTNTLYTFTANGVVVCIFCAVLCFAFSAPLVKVFLTEASALTDGVNFTRIFISTAWLFGLYYVLLNALQAMGAAKPSFVVSVCRQGIIYIPAVFIMGGLLGVNGLVWAQPVADILYLLLVVILLLCQLKKKNIWR